jgi:hypothetical protein
VTSARRPAPGALLVTALAAATAACGASGGQPADTASLHPTAASDPLAGWTVQRIAKQSQADTLAAPYVGVTGSASDSGHLVSFDLTMVAGLGCRGSVTEQGLGSFTLISNGKTVWVKPDAAFYRSMAAGDPQVTQAEALLAGKYLEDPAGTGLGSLTSTCSLRGMLGDSQSATDDDSFTKAGTAVIGGQRALKFASSKDHGYVYVSDRATPEVLRIATTDSGGASLSFTYHGTAPAITPPPAGEVLNGSQYGF